MGAHHQLDNSTAVPTLDRGSPLLELTVSQALEVFGFKRRTPAQLAVLEQAVSHVIGRGRLSVGAGELLSAS